MSSVASELASRLMTAIAIGSLSTAAAGVATAIVLTGSVSPAVWFDAYRHSQECTAPSAAQDPNCSAAAAQEWAQRQLAAELEQQAADMKARTKTQPAVVDPPAGQTDPAPPLPKAATRSPQSDDSGEAGDD